MEGRKCILVKENLRRKQFTLRFPPQSDHSTPIWDSEQIKNYHYTLHFRMLNNPAEPLNNCSTQLTISVNDFLTVIHHSVVVLQNSGLELEI